MRIRKPKIKPTESLGSFAVKYCLALLLCISIYVNALTYQSNKVLKKEKENLMIENAIIMQQGIKLYESYQSLLELIKKKIEEEQEMERRRKGREA